MFRQKIATMVSKLVSSVAVFLMLHATASAGDDGDRFVYYGFAAANLTLAGNAAVTPGGLLEVTNATFDTKGHAFRPTPLHLLTSKPAAAAANDDSTAAARDQGLAFVVAPTTAISTANGGGQYLGIDVANGSASDGILAVELDTLMNPELRDIDSNHVGIDVDSLVSRQARPAGFYNAGAGGSFQELKLNSREPMQVWVDYDGQARQLDVTLAPVRVPKPKKPLLSMNIDLSTVVADPVYVGFSAASNVMLTCHYVLGWSFSLDGPASPLDLSKLPVLPQVGSKPRSKVLVVALPLAIVLLLAAMLSAVILTVWRRHRYAEVREDWEDEFGPHRFSYKDLFHATGGFKDSNLLGVGGFGRVYKGVLPDSSLEIAVKKVSHDSRQGVREFVAEVLSIGRIRHRNLVQLLGYCRRKGELLLVYDYMANGSLDRHLHDQQLPVVLSWNERYRIIKGVAASLLYLHEDCEKVVIHRDIKSSNVLLDHEMESKLSDFGLAKLYDHGTDPQSTRVAGTIGYLAPELIRTGKATPLTDVFAFGVLLLEVACGRRPIDRDDRNNQIVLVDWVIEHHDNGSILDVVDPRLMGKYEREEVILVLKLGLICAHPMPSVRPSMRRVMQYLESSQSIPPDLSLMRNERFDQYVNLDGLSIASIGSSSVTILLEGR
ncbi:unnamed protein product [Urochloa decumbens]|uniref:non-specific serine/threonine protein kinase n=1 Tax=Urochloa decumbens TaxID=240449 RepID=A0ABC9G3P1_9POAL